MPSASVKVISGQHPSKENEAKGQQNAGIDPLDAFKQTITLVEHKIRNMEKRKGKLDAYKQEQEQGKELNADQLAAVAKYGEVVQTLEFARDLVKQVTQFQIEANRLLKKQLKKEQAEKAAAELERSKQTILLSSCLQQLAVPRIREDFASGKNGAVQLGKEDLKAIDELSVVSGLKLKEENFNQQLDKAAEHLLNLVEGKAKPVCASSGKTYKDLKDLLTSLTDCEYFDSTDASRVAPHDNSESDEVLAPGNNPAQVKSQQEGNYKLKDTQMDIQSLHMDPAVVAVSNVAPPQMGSQVRGPQQHLAHHQVVAPTMHHQQHAEAGHNAYQNNANDAIYMNRNHQPMGDMNLNHLRNDGNADCGDIDWNNPEEPKAQSTKFRKNSGHNSDNAEDFDQPLNNARGNNNWDGGDGNGSRGYRRGGGDRGGSRGNRTNGYSGRGGRGRSNHWNGPPNEDRFSERDREYKPRGGGAARGVGNGRGGYYSGRGNRRPYRGGYAGQDQGSVNAY